MQAVTSMTKCYHLRALALLGALILFFFLWPIYCCSARPTGRLLMNTPNTNSQRSRILNQKNDEHESISSIEHQNYEEFLKITGVSDKVDRKREIVNFLNSGENNLKATYDNDKGTIKDNGNENMYSNNLSLNQQTLIENVAETFLTNSETMTTSVYELFYLKNKSKPESSNQILSRTNRSVHLNSSNNRNNSVSGAKRVKNNKEKLSTLDRNERSANLSHISGSARKIQLYIKNRFLQLLADGTVNGTTDDMSDFNYAKGMQKFFKRFKPFDSEQQQILRNSLATLLYLHNEKEKYASI
ncbi:CLUMA_CG014876, isoform A [Clunio marinus]|uniref:CLUMA_CG014876, isoform A n=1 Tax=Clunio marinus TaxID=568069 RepID=A0A1J1IN50_9DIPT|nr:CLUMA_CG014876, isoform A [Clunio marinus]